MIELDPRARYGCADVARWLGHAPEWFSRNRHRMEQLDGFPPPISRVGRPRWLGRDLIAWEQRDKRRSGEIVHGPREVVFDFSPALRERARQIAGGKRP